MEKYVGECLESILEQTFQDFEVIVVDDCSTDNSRDIVESYLPKFNTGEGVRLRLIRSKVNSNLRPAIPRNKGLRYAVGEYVYFMDSDDALISDALEILYLTAKKFNADVVNTHICYMMYDEFLTKLKSIVSQNENKIKTSIKNELKPPEIIPPTLEARMDLIKKIAKNIRIKLWNELVPICYMDMRTEMWNNLIRREFLIENNLTFPEYLSIADDTAFLLQLVSSAEKFIYIYEPFYIWRQRKESHFNAIYSQQENLKQKCRDILGRIKFVEEFETKPKLFEFTPEFKYIFFNFAFSEYSYRLFPIYDKTPIHLLDETIREVIDSLGNDTAMTAFLFSRLNVANSQLKKLSSGFKQLNELNQKQKQLIWSQQKKIFELQRQLKNK